MHSSIPVVTRALLMLVVVGCQPSDETPAAGALAGEYGRRHDVFVFHGNEPVQVEVTDRLVLAALDPETLHLDLRLFTLDGKECAIEGHATRRPGNYLFTEPEASGGCTLRIETREAGIVLTDVASRCGATHCATTEAIGRALFSPVPASP